MPGELYGQRNPTTYQERTLWTFAFQGAVGRFGRETLRELQEGCECIGKGLPRLPALHDTTAASQLYAYSIDLEQVFWPDNATDSEVSGAGLLKHTDGPIRVKSTSTASTGLYNATRSSRNMSFGFVFLQCGIFGTNGAEWISGQRELKPRPRASSP